MNNEIYPILYREIDTNKINFEEVIKYDDFWFIKIKYNNNNFYVQTPELYNVIDLIYDIKNDVYEFLIPLYNNEKKKIY